MKNRYVKKIQRKVNKLVRELNNIIINDELWKGRFIVLQNKRAVTNEEGYITVWFWFKFYDKQTKKVKLSDTWYNYFQLFTFNKLAQELNDFIVKDCNIWYEDPKPNRETSINYRSN